MGGKEKTERRFTALLRRHQFPGGRQSGDRDPAYSARFLRNVEIRQIRKKAVKGIRLSGRGKQTAQRRVHSLGALAEKPHHTACRRPCRGIPPGQKGTPAPADAPPYFSSTTETPHGVPSHTAPTAAIFFSFASLRRRDSGIAFSNAGRSRASSREYSVIVPPRFQISDRLVWHA